MPYLEQVIHAGLRFVPPINGAYAGDRIPKGWTILFRIRLTHRLTLWNHPKQFDPDRFSSDRTAPKQKKFSDLPFGDGARMGVGRTFAMVELSIILALLVRRYTGSLTPN